LQKSLPTTYHQQIKIVNNVPYFLSNHDNADNRKIKSTLNHAILFVKEHFERVFSPLKNYFALNLNNIDQILKINI